MGARQAVVMGGLLLAAAGGAAHAQRATFEPSKLSVFVPSGWQVMRERAGDFLHYETAADGGRSFDLTFERVALKCKAWKAEPGTKKEFPAYWPKTARTGLFTARGDGKIKSTGCLADVAGGALVVGIEITVDAPKYKPDKDDTTALREALDAVLEGAGDLPALPSTRTTSTSTSTGTNTTNMPGATIPGSSDALGDPATKGGSTVTVPRLDMEIRLPKAAAWHVGIRGESTIRRADASRPALVATLSPLLSRTCNEWRVDMAANELGSYETRPAYLPSAVKVGAFFWLSAGTQLATCVPTKAGTLGISIDYATQLDGEDVTIVRQLLEAIAVGASKHTAPLVAATKLLEPGSSADATIGAIKLPKGAVWRVENGTVERLDTGKYFSLSSMSRPNACAASEAKAQPYLPAGIKAVVSTRPWGTTVAKLCVQTSRTIELTLAYDGAIAAADHALIKALIEAFVPTKKLTPKS